MTSRFKEALKMFEGEYNSCEEFVNENADKFPTVKLALKIADRLERGDVSDEMWKNATQIKNVGHYPDVYRAMAKQLIKEEEK